VATPRLGGRAVKGRVAALAVLVAAGCGVPDATSGRVLERGEWESRLRASFCAPAEGFGFDCGPQARRLEATRDSVTLDAHAAVLDGAAPVAGAADSAMLLWWLAEGGRPRDAGQFIRRVAPYDYPNYEDQSFAAWYGVARHAATNAAAAAQLARLPEKIGPFQRGRLTMMLALVNDTTARAALRRLRATENFPPHLAAIADSVLAWPALPPFAGRWPCSADQRPGRTASGAFGCVADRAATLVIGSPAGPREVGRLTTGERGTIAVTAEGASPSVDGEAAVTISIDARSDSALVHLPLSVAAPMLGTLQSLVRMNRLPWALVRTMDNSAAQVMAGGSSDAAANRFTVRKLTPWARPWEVAIVNDRGVAGPVRVRLTRAELEALARSLERAVAAAREDAARGSWRLSGK